MTDQAASKDEIIAKGQQAERMLDELEPYFRIVEAMFTEELVAISGWRAVWRGDRRRAEAANKIKTVRMLRQTLYRVVQQGKVASAPVRRASV